MLRFLFCILFPFLVWSDPFWTPLPDVVAGTSSLTFAINASPAGKVVVAWIDNGGAIQSSFLDSTTNTWSTPITISNATSIFANLAIAIDDAGDAAATWVDSSNAKVQASYKASASANWGTIFTSSVSGTIFSTPRITIDANGVPFIGWTQLNGNSVNNASIAVATYLSNSWTDELVRAEARSPYPGFVIGNPEGDVLAFWVGGSQVFSQSFRLIYSSRAADGIWSPSVTLNPGSPAGASISAAISSTAITATATEDINFVTTNLDPTSSSDWTSTSIPFTTVPVTVTAINDGGFATILAIGQLAPFMFNIYASSLQLPPGTWSPLQQLNSVTYGEPVPISCTVDGSNLSIAAWYDGTDILYSYASGLESWVTEEILEASASRPALTTDDIGETYIAWVTGSGTLKVSVHTSILPPNTPLNFKGRTILDNYGVQSELSHDLKWSAAIGATSYSIYSDENLTNLILNTTSLHTKIHNRSFTEPYTYYLVSVNNLGVASTPTSLTIPSYN